MKMWKLVYVNKQTHQGCYSDKNNIGYRSTKNFFIIDESIVTKGGGRGKIFFSLNT